MPELNFQMHDAKPQCQAAEPMLLFNLGIIETTQTPIQSVMLRCQIRIEPGRRRYRAAEQERLLDLFGTPERWGQTVRPMLWTHVSLIVPGFTGSTLVDVPVPCSYDFSLAVTKYFDALEDGDIPLCLLFSGTVFYESEQGLRVAQIPWEKVATYRLPAATWKKLMDLYYPNSAWLRLPKELFDRLAQYKSRRGLPTLERTLETLLAEEPVAP
jgi:hypothetical protein